jgi:hypothetical protein
MPRGQLRLLLGVAQGAVLIGCSLPGVEENKTSQYYVRTLQSRDRFGLHRVQEAVEDAMTQDGFRELETSRSEQVPGHQLRVEGTKVGRADQLGGVDAAVDIFDGEENTFDLRMDVASFGVSSLTSERDKLRRMVGEQVRRREAEAVSEEVIEKTPRLEEPLPRLRDRYVLSIGVSKYGDRTIRQLPNARADAEAIDEMLRHPRGARVHPENARLLTDDQAIRARIEAELDRLREVTAPDDMVILFFAGHGFAPGEVEQYLCPYDGHPRLKQSLISRNFLKEKLDLIPARRQVIILDACNSLNEETRGVPRETFKELGEELPDVRRIVITSTAGDQLALDQKEGSSHSPFTDEILNACYGRSAAADRDSNGLLTAEEIFQQVYVLVSAYAEKRGYDMTPQLEGAGPHEIEVTPVIRGTAAAASGARVTVAAEVGSM